MCQCTLFDVGGVEIHSIECIEYCTKDQSNVEDVEDNLRHASTCFNMLQHTYIHTYMSKMSKIIFDMLQQASTYIRFDGMVGKP